MIALLEAMKSNGKGSANAKSKGEKLRMVQFAFSWGYL